MLSRAFVVCLGQRIDQLAQDRRGVADQRHLRLAIARRFFRIGVDTDHGQRAVDAPRRHRIELGADREHRIGFFPQLMPKRQRDAEGIAAVEHTASTPIGQHRSLQHVRQLRHFGRCILGAAAGDDENALGFAQELSRGAHGVVIDARRTRRRGQRDRSDLAAFAPNVDRAFERGGTGAALMHRRNRLGDFARCFRWTIDARRMIDQPRNDAGLIADLVQVAQALADRLGRDLADQRQHRRVHAVGGQQRGTGVQQAGARDHGIGLRLAGRERGAQCHIGRALLVAGMDDGKLVAGALEGVEQVVIVDAGQCINGLETM